MATATGRRTTGRRRAALEHGPLRHAEPDGCPLRLDLHLPAGGGPWPVALWLHGGGWAVGARTCALTSVRCRWRTGVAVAAVQYRLTDRATFPAQLDDARAAVRWQRAHGAGHGLSTDRDGELGDSSVQAVVSWFPPTDLLSHAGDVPDGAPGSQPDDPRARRRPAVPAGARGPGRAGARRSQPPVGRGAGGGGSAGRPAAHRRRQPRGPAFDPPASIGAVRGFLRAALG